MTTQQQRVDESTSPAENLPEFKAEQSQSTEKVPEFLSEIADSFNIHGDYLGARPYGSGHINDTYAVGYSQGGRLIRYIFQRINDQIFTDPPKLMDNIVRVTERLRANISKSDGADISRRALTVIPARDGKPYVRDSNGSYWRAYIFIEKAKSFDVLENDRQAYEAARTFGEFQKALSDLNDPPLHETIPNFHNGMFRYQQFLEALDKNSEGRADQARREIDFLQKRVPIFEEVRDALASGELPLRVTHNDTKINNVMLDEATGEGLCVIDLDTVMPGTVLYDFGDLARTSTSRSAEDEQDLSKVKMEMSRFEQLATGYLASAGEFLEKSERDRLVLASKMITLIIGSRFLTDYLAGDVYFKTHRPGHNLDRCRVQFALVDSMEQQENQMRSLIERL